MVHRQYRGSTLALRLAAACFVYGSECGVRNWYIDCDIDNIPFFRRLGYVPHLNWFEHPEFGLGAVMRLDVQNLEQLIAIKSPFYRLIEDQRRSVEIGVDHA